MQNMQSRFAYAKYAKICTPHVADAGLRQKAALKASVAGSTA